MRAKVLLLALWSTPACAQSAVFQEISWGSSVESVTQRLRALGYREVAPPGLMLVWGSEAERIGAMFGPRGLYYLHRARDLGAGEADRAFAEVRDSLIAAIGRRADTLQSLRAVWVLPSGVIEVERAVPGEYRTSHGVVIAHFSPRHEQESAAFVEQYMREHRERNQEWFRSRVDRERWGVLYAEDADAVSYDRRSVNRPSAGVIRLWLRYDYRWTQTRTAYPRERFNYMLEHAEIRCRPMATRRSEAHWYLNGNNVHAMRLGSFSTWEPVIPGSIGEALATEACRLLGR
jgi:hypothetical protein